MCFFKRKFLVLVLLILASNCYAVVEFNGTPTDDIWVKPGATNPTGDTLLRAWGYNGYSVAPGGYPFSGSGWENYISYSYLKWDLDSIPAGAYTVEEALLTVIHQHMPPFTQAEGEAYPLEVRGLSPYFSEATWTYNDPNNQNPGELFGNGDLSAYNYSFRFPIPTNLLQNASLDESKSLNAHVNKSINSTSKDIAFALTSTMDSGGHGETMIYRVYSKEAGGGIVAPELYLKLQPIDSVSISQSKQISVGERVYIQNAVVTANFHNEMNTIYISNSERTSGIGVKYLGELENTLINGDTISIIGKIALWNSSEIGIDCENIIVVDAPNQEINPLGMNNKSTGGGEFGFQPAVKGSSGLNNIGMFIKTFGVVTGNNLDFADPFGLNNGVFWIDDGSNIADGFVTGTQSSSKGIAVLMFDDTILPTGYVSVSGILRAIQGPNGVERLLIPVSIETY